MAEPQRYFWTEEDIKKLPSLPEPVETFDVEDGEITTFKVERWGIYQHIIHPTWPGAPAEKLVIALRLWQQEKYRPPRAPYWDIHQGHLISMLMPFLQRVDYKDYEIIVTKRGVAPKAYFELEFKKPE